MKTTNIIQRLCLFLFVLVLALPAVATNYGREGYETFRSRNLGTHKKVTTLKQGKVEITFSSCTTSGSSGNGAIYQPAKGSRITVEADDGYSIRWIILRDTEGGERYSHPKGKYRISSVTSGYDYYFEKKAISNSYISGGNQNNLNDDDNNIVVYQYDASAQSVDINTHNKRDWDQFKVRDIIVGYVRAPKVRFEKDRYDMYYKPIFHPQSNSDDHSGNREYKVDNHDIATVNASGTLKFKRPGTVVLTTTFSASENCAKAQCSTTVTTKRDGVTFTSEGLPDVIFNNTSYSIRDYLNNSKTKSGEKFDYNDESFSVISSNPDVLRYDDHWLKFGGTAGEATITLKQEQNNYYEATTFSHTFIVARRDQYGTILIKDANEWKVFCKLVNEKGMTNLNARLEADVNLGGDIAMVGTTSHLYAGTFDGQNHTLKFSWNGGSDSDIAPFKKVSNATIKNLRTEGTIKSNSYYLSGLVGDAYGTVNISNCASNVNITSSHTGGICDAAGMISYIDSSAKVAITDCLVEGNITAMTDEGKKRMSGFVFYQYGTCTLTNCLYIGENNADNTNGDSNTFANNATVTNCYYLNACNKVQGTQITKEQLKSGEVAYQLQAGRNNMVWGQTIGTNNEPRLIAFDNSAKKVYQVKFTYNNEVKATRYANSGKTVSLPTLTAKDIMGNEYNTHHYYTGITFESFSASTTVSGDRTVRIIINKKDYYEIASADNWKEFCNIVNGGQTKLNAKMIKNVDLGSEIMMAGTSSNPYAGTFDGQNHTLTLNWNTGDRNDIAPFRNVKGATIKNLHTEGTITSSSYFLAGLIDEARGTNIISGCASNVNIKSTYASDRCGVGGLISYIYSGANVAISDCLVKGNINAKEAGRKGMGGFVYGQNGTCTLTNCLYVGTNNAENNGDRTNTFAHNATLNNCYYLNACGKAQGTQVTAEQLKSGEVTYKLQNGRDTQFWGQTLGTDNEPRLIAFDNSAKKVYQVAFTYNNEVRATRYANSGKTVSLPTIKDFMGTGYNLHHYYTIAFAGGFNGSTTVDADRTVTVTLTEKDCYDIASKEDWKALRELVNDGQTGVDARLMQDVDLDEEILMLGYRLPNIYEGTFDGQGHTLSFSWDAGSRNEIAPFKNVKDATIRNLRTQGKITSSGYDSQLSGLINYAYGNTTISGCVSEVDLKGRISLAGILQWPDDTAHITINDCLVKGNFHATSDLNGGTSRTISGFIAHRHKDAACTLNNCLYLGTSNALDHDKTSHTFSSDFEHNEGTGFTRINNCYYLNPCGKAQGDRVTAEQLKSGEVAKMLQAGRTDQCYWAQALGEEPSPYRETGKAETNYVYYDTANSRWACEDFRLTDAKPLPIGLDFIAARATYERTFAASGKATICLPYELPANGFKAYTISGGNNSAVYFAEAKDKLEAYKPYLITVDGVPQLGGENIEVKAFNDDKLTTPAGKYKFVGTVSGMDNASATAANAYILQEDGKFHKVTTEHSEAMLPAYRAYIQRNDSGAKQLSIVIDGETTGIGGVTNGRADGPVYDLQGRRVADRLDDARRRLPAGVYIVGGRKIILK